MGGPLRKGDSKRWPALREQEQREKELRKQQVRELQEQHSTLKNENQDADGRWIRASPYMPIAEKAPLLFRYAVAPEATVGSMGLVLATLRRKREQERAFNQRVIGLLQQMGGVESRWRRRRRKRQKKSSFSLLLTCCVKAYRVFMLFTITRKVLFFITCALLFFGMIAGMVFVADRHSDEWAGQGGRR